MKAEILQFATAALLSAAAASSVHAGFMGKTLQATYYVPDLATPYPSATATPTSFTVSVAPAVQTSVGVEDVTQIAVHFTDTSVRFDFTTSLSTPTWNPASFNGVAFDLLAGGPLSLASASIDPSSTLSGFNVSRVSLSNAQLTIDWNGLSYVNGTSLLINFTSAPASVPEPGSLALLAMALTACGCIARRKQEEKPGSQQQEQGAFTTASPRLRQGKR